MLWRRARFPGEGACLVVASSFAATADLRTWAAFVSTFRCVSAMSQSSYLFESLFLGVVLVGITTAEGVKTAPQETETEMKASADALEPRRSVQLTATHGIDPASISVTGKRSQSVAGGSLLPIAERDSIAQSKPQRLPAITDVKAASPLEPDAVGVEEYPTVIDEHGVLWRIIDSRPCDPANCQGLVP